MTVMRPLLALCSLAVIGFACKSSSTSAPPVEIAFSFSSPEARAAGDAIDAFAAELHGAVASQDGNLFYSPTSISIALAMTEGGARGATKAEMDKVLHLPAGAQATYAGLLAKLGASKNPELSIASRLYGDKTLAFDLAFVKTTRDVFGAPLESVDFKHDAEGARGQVNAWVSSKTNHRISDLLAPGAVNTDTRLVLTNAIYFKGRWAHAFDTASTRDGVFHAKTDETVPMMHQTLTAKLGEHANAQSLELDYQASDGPKLSMVIVLPKNGHSIGEVEKTYARDGVAPFVASETSTEDVEVTLPKFKAQTSMDLGKTLEGLGMKLAFSENADFSGITKEPLAISKVIHKAFVDVDEQGTEAAAATTVGVAAVTTSIKVPKRFVADHPFLFFIRDTDSGTILFAGRLADPKQG